MLAACAPGASLAHACMPLCMHACKTCPLQAGHLQRQAVILDNHVRHALDGLWAAVVAGGGPQHLRSPWNATAPGVQDLPRLCTLCEARAARALELQSGTVIGRRRSVTALLPCHAGGASRLVRRLEELPAPARFAGAAFVPPGYTSLLFSSLTEASACGLPTSLFAGFREFLLRPLGLLRAPALPREAPLQAGPLEHLASRRALGMLPFW